VRAGEVTLVRSTQAVERPPTPGVVTTPSAQTPAPDDDEFTTAPPAPPGVTPDPGQVDPAAPVDPSSGDGDGDGDVDGSFDADGPG
jgi:hypothetical protein